MGENTKIEWADHTWNPWLGCTKVSPACDHCYAADMMDTRYGRVRWGLGEDRVRTSESNWRLPYRWDRAAKAAGRRATVFCLSLGDIWDNEVEPEWRNQALKVMQETPNLVYLLLSKRIGNAIAMCDPFRGNRMLPRNAALGATMINQAEYDRDAPKLEHAGRALGALFTFASIEPMLGPISIRRNAPDWIICGGESGNGARPMHPDWIRALRDQSDTAGKPFLFKQWGEFGPCELYPAGTAECSVIAFDGQHLTGEAAIAGYPEEYRAEIVARFGKHRAGRLLDGIAHNGRPALLEVPIPA